MPALGCGDEACLDALRTAIQPSPLIMVFGFASKWGSFIACFQLLFKAYSLKHTFYGMPRFL